MQGITVRGVTLGRGPVKIIVPIFAQTEREAVEQARALRENPCADLVEFRADALCRDAEPESVLQALAAVRAALGPEKPLLFTLRTAGEGGLSTLAPERYAELLCAVCAAGCADLLDLESQTEQTLLARVQAAARGAGVPVLLSRHYFRSTPAVRQMVHELCMMQAAGGDLCKLAVMPRSPAETAALLQAGAMAAAALPSTPLILVSMGAPGAISRVCGGAFGSCASFGTNGPASAPGQPRAAALRAALDAIADCL